MNLNLHLNYNGVYSTNLNLNIKHLNLNPNLKHLNTVNLNLNLKHLNPNLNFNLNQPPTDCTAC